MKKIINYYPIILFMITLLSLIFMEKYLHIAPNLNINSSLIIYPFSFLILTTIYHHKGIKYTKQTIFFTFLFLLLFYFMMTILNSIEGITSSKNITDSLRTIFTPNSFTIDSKFIYYPKLEIVLTFSLVYFISHYIFITIYEATLDVTYNIIAFILSLLIGFILDELLFIPLSNLSNLINKTMIYEDLIKLMTANFIMVIFSSIIIFFIYSLRHIKR